MSTNSMYRVYTPGHKYPVGSLHSVSMSKSMFPYREAQSKDGSVYDTTRKGVCTLEFVDDMSPYLTVGSYIFLVRDMTSVGSDATLSTTIKDRSVVFQGIVVHSGWSQYVDNGQNFSSMYNVRVFDLTHLLMDGSFFPYSFFENAYTPKWKYDKALEDIYGIR